MNDLNLEKLGEQKFNNFCRKIKELTIDSKATFDLVVAVGNSGLVMGKFTKLIYENLGLNFPPQLSIPFYRFYLDFRDDMSKLFDNNIFLPEVIKQIKDISKIDTVLFVDDKIGSGITAVGCLELIKEALKRIQKG